MLEVAVTLGLAAVVAAIVWQAGSLAASLRLRSAAVTLLSDLRTAQARAMAERNPARAHGVQFQVDSDQYLMVEREGATVITSQVRRLPAGVHVTYARFGGATPTAALFDGTSLFGAPSGGGSVTLAGDRMKLCVRLLPATGRIRIARLGCL